VAYQSSLRRSFGWQASPKRRLTAIASAMAGSNKGA
jgi:hypothetical protein